MTQLCQKWLIKPGPSAALINKEENLLQAHYNSIHSIIKSIPVLTLRSVRSRKKKKGKQKHRGGRGVVVVLCVCVCVCCGEGGEMGRGEGWGYTPDSDLAQSTHPFPIIQDDTVEERLREEKGSQRRRGKKRMGIGYEAPPIFFFCMCFFSNCFHACIVPTHKQ